VSNGIHLAVEATGTKFGGLETGLLTFLERALQDERVGKITLFCSSGRYRSFDLPSSPKIRTIENGWCERNYVLRVGWYELGLGISCRIIHCDVLLAFSEFGIGRFAVPHVTWVRQSLPFDEEAIAAFNSSRWRFHIMMVRHQMRRSCRSAQQVLAQSSVMKDWICSSFKIDPQKVTVIYSSPKPMPAPLYPSPKLAPMRLDNSGPRLLYVGSEYPYKKLDTAVVGLAGLREVWPEAQLFLTLPEDHTYGAKPGVNCLGYLRGADLTEAYQLADALILPSLVESGPQTPLEAMSLGRPVLVADRPYAHDVCRDAAVFFDPWSPSDLVRKASLLFSDERLRKSLVQKGMALVQERRAAKPYEQMLDVLIETARAKT
jgi:glycosyltransferase involved in cell wall biosynthesis